jgi:hypothetical protein
MYLGGILHRRRPLPDTRQPRASGNDGVRHWHTNRHLVDQEGYGRQPKWRQQLGLKVRCITLQTSNLSTNSTRYFCRSKIDYPNNDTTRASRKYVRAMKSLTVSALDPTLSHKTPADFSRNLSPSTLHSTAHSWICCKRSSCMTPRTALPPRRHCNTHGSKSRLSMMALRHTGSARDCSVKAKHAPSFRSNFHSHSGMSSAFTLAQGLSNGETRIQLWVDGFFYFISRVMFFNANGMGMVFWENHDHDAFYLHTLDGVGSRCGTLCRIRRMSEFSFVAPHGRVDPEQRPCVFGVMRAPFVCFIYAIIKELAICYLHFLLRLLWNPAWEA